MVRYPGGYTSYRSLRRDEVEVEVEAKAEREKPALVKARAGLTYGEEIELGSIMERIESAEARVATLEAELADPSVYEGGGTRAADLASTHADAKEALEMLIARWEELELKREPEPGGGDG